MNSSTILSLAILKVNWDVRKVGYLENFMPLVAECLRLMPSDIVTAQNLQVEMKTRFGLALPQKTLETLIKRAKKHNYVIQQGLAYVRNAQILSKLNFADVQSKVLDKHDSLVKALVTFCAERFGHQWNESQAEAALQSYLQGAQLIVGLPVPDTVIPSVQAPAGSAKYYVASFVQYLNETQDPLLGHLDTVVKGNMLANSVFLADPDAAARKFKKTEVYFDSQFLIYALGYAGEPRKAPCLELLKLLYEAGAELRCFSHTTDEIRDILDAVANIVRDNRDAYGPAIATVEYFIAKGDTSSDIELIKVSLEKDLDRLHIRKVNTPEYQQPVDEQNKNAFRLVTDEKGLDDALAKDMAYGRDLARQRDVASVSAILRLREARERYILEECRAIFTTTNSTLARVCNTHLCKSFDCVPPCITDYSLTNLLWLKKPTLAPDLPRKRIIADCYAAMQPDEKLWRHYSQEIQKLKANNTVSSEEYYMLRYSLEARQALMELTQGDDTAITEATIPEMLQMIREKLQHELKEKLKSAEQEKLSLQQEVEQQKVLGRKAQERSELDKVNRENRIVSRAAGLAKFAAWASCVGVYVALISVAVLAFPFGVTVTPTPVWRYVISAAFVIGLIWTIQNQFRGTNMKTMMRVVERRVSEWLVKLIHRISD